MKPEQPNHTDRGHAEFSPSSLKYVAACPAYEGKDGTSEAAEKGTRIHEALEIRDPSALHNEEEVEIYDEIVTMEAEFMLNFPPIFEEHNEIQVDVALNGTATFGTCDRFLILEGGTRAVMADYKTGISVIDPPESNWQAKAYVIGVFQKFENIDEIVFVFYVPLHNASPHHTFKREDLPKLIEEVSDVIRAGEVTRPKWGNNTLDLSECNPNQNCRFCKHEDECPALGYYAVEVTKKIEIDPYNIDDLEYLPELFNIAKIVENWAASVKKRALEALRNGDDLAGLKLRSMGQVRKIEDNATFMTIAESHGLDAENVIDNLNIPLAKIAKLVGDQASKAARVNKVQNFMADCEDAGIVSTSEERHCVISQ